MVLLSGVTMFSISSATAEKGYTLIELSITLAVISVLIVGGLSGIQSIMNIIKVSEQVKIVAKLSSRISVLYQGTSAGVTQLQVAQMGGWDTNRITIASNLATVKSAFGTREVILPNANNDIGDIKANSGFQYVIKSVPQVACTDLAMDLRNFAFAMQINQADTANELEQASSTWVATTTPPNRGRQFELFCAGRALQPQRGLRLWGGHRHPQLRLHHRPQTVTPCWAAPVQHAHVALICQVFGDFVTTHTQHRIRCKNATQFFFLKKLF
jgi:prepilin-type N-terminal cleavage/methylation domain-containing protein